MSEIATMKRYGVRKPRLVRRKARKFSLPLDMALAMLEKETGIPQHNIFGHDCSASPCFAGQVVTNAKVDALLDSAYSNGVGWTQLTYKPLVRLAHARRGGAAKIANQLEVGFKYLGSLYAQYGEWGAFERYNGSAAYANDAVAKANRWYARFHS